MSIAVDKALDILVELIRKPETQTNDIPAIWESIIKTYNTTFSPPVVEVKKKRRKHKGNPNLQGWPRGISREEYRAWKDELMAKGVTEGLNPREYKRLKDAGILESPKAEKNPPKAKKK